MNNEEIEKILSKIKNTVGENNYKLALAITGHRPGKIRDVVMSSKDGELLLEYITKLQSNWNELKKWLEEQKEFINDIPTFSNDIKNNHIGMVGAYNNSLDKMQEMEGNNE